MSWTIWSDCNWERRSKILIFERDKDICFFSPMTMKVFDHSINHTFRRSCEAREDNAPLSMYKVFLSSFSESINVRSFTQFILFWRYSLVHSFASPLLSLSSARIIKTRVHFRCNSLKYGLLSFLLISCFTYNSLHYPAEFHFAVFVLQRVGDLCHKFSCYFEASSSEELYIFFKICLLFLADNVHYDERSSFIRSRWK